MCSLIFYLNGFLRTLLFLRNLHHNHPRCQLTLPNKIEEQELKLVETPFTSGVSYSNKPTQLAAEEGWPEGLSHLRRSCSSLWGLCSSTSPQGAPFDWLRGWKTWCVAKPSASNEILALNLDYACSQVSCAVIQKGGPCYYPDNLVSRAAVAMNLYYAANGRHAWNCYFNNSAIVVQSDPSYGSCTYY
ncbi:hypothetical protein EJB05_30226, partial [Eragrostis curvula]